MKSLKLVSYNIQKCVGLDFRRDPGRVLDVLNGTGADIVVLQEADKRFGYRPAALPPSLIETHSDYIPVPVDSHPESLGWHGNAVLVRRGMKTGEAQGIDLPGTEPRGAVTVAAGGIRVVGVHLGLLRRDRRRQLVRLLEELPQDRLPVAILGDFNEWSRARGLEELSPSFEVHVPGRSFHAARPVAALDRVALGHGLMLEDAGVIESGKARIASDHLPVWARISRTAAAAKAS